MPGLKVPAWQANRVAARPCPPLASGGGMVDRRRGWCHTGMNRRRNHGVAAKRDQDEHDDEDDLYARGDARGGRARGARGLADVAGAEHGVRPGL